jgi:flagellar protein FliS
MTSITVLRDRYQTDAVATMSPARLVVALYDRLLLDLDRALAALAGSDARGAHEALVHAQDVVGELHDSLDLSVWPAGAPLAAVYRFLLEQLVAANVEKQPLRVAECRDVVRPLRDAWHEASGLVAAPGGGAA